MRLVLGVLLVASGCHLADRTRNPGRAEPKARIPERETPPADWTRSPSTKADTLAGFVVLPDGTPAGNVPIEIETGLGPGAPVEVRTDSAGYFRIPGLKSQQPYTLTAKAAQNGMQYLGKLYARTGTDKSQRIRIELVEGGPALPETPRTGTGLPAPQMPALPVPTFTPSDVAIPGPSAANTAPEAFVETLPPPLVVRTPTPVMPTVTPPPPLTVAPRPDLQAAQDAQDAPYKPPVAVIPPLRGPAPRSEAVGVRKVTPTGTEFTLVDAANVPRDYPTGGWVLLDFMTTSCRPCVKSVPLLTALQEQYAGQRLEVIGVCCDDATGSVRRRRIAEYAKQHAAGYPLLTEPADEPGALLERFRVEAYPTLILLDGEGKEVWRGHPADARELGRHLKP